MSNARVNVVGTAGIVLYRRYVEYMQGSMAGCMDVTCRQMWYGDPFVDGL